MHNNRGQSIDYSKTHAKQTAVKKMDEALSNIMRSIYPITKMSILLYTAQLEPVPIPQLLLISSIGNRQLLSRTMEYGPYWMRLNPVLVIQSH